MTSTLLLCWYACGWICVMGIACEEQELTTSDVIISFVFGSLILALYPVFWLAENKDRVIWRKP